MRLRCVATNPDGTSREEWVAADTVDDTFYQAYGFAAANADRHVAVYDENGDLEFDSPPWSP